MKRLIYLAWKNLFDGPSLAPRIRSSLLAVALGLVPFVVVLHVSDGMIEAITRRFLETTTYHFQAFAYAPDLSMEEGVERLAAEGFLAVPEIQGMGLLVNGVRREGVTIRAVPSWWWEKDEGLRSSLSIEKGRFDLSSPRHMVVGVEVARTLGISVGDKVKLLVLRSFGGGTILPRIATFEVTGVTSTGYQDVDKLWVYVPFEWGDRVFDRRSSRAFLGIKVEDPFHDMEALRSRIAACLGAGWVVLSWKDLGRAQFLSFSTSRALLLAIMGLLVLIAALSISSSLVMLVLERAEEIAMLKSIGVPPRLVSRAYLWTGMLVGMAGSLAGMACGLLISLYINELFAFLEHLVNLWLRLAAGLRGGSYEPVRILSSDFYVERIPVHPSPFVLWLIFVGASLIAFLASWGPARYVLRISPVEVLRREG
ncbi:ABC transporter permease [Spirochaeta thermophila]|uniref:Lipoprotein releasing system, transmembrane protein, LolC/E family n=1 Tax=Winmispira thermophila (strain ATCC 49972 / DSM 6192 / RI 19.B1) TaxID=665571 RepID=E0RT45_WINT6|nr:FtsX-like permease family protein [Spirochaeta thermophila]ADN02182.1 lipoprotein releasing system, transmembrane protein, LolC/E family [Spirochaeta thermophila DSM 6192]